LNVMKIIYCFFMLAAMAIGHVEAANTYTLVQVVDVALTQSPSVMIAKAQEDAATASVTTAKSYLNPQLEFGAGPSHYRDRSLSKGTKGNWGVALSQTLEFSDVRRARREVAESGVKTAGFTSDLIRLELKVRVKNAFYNVLQKQEVLKLVEADQQLLQTIRDRVKLKTDIGESPKYELIKAETELLAAQRDYQAALVRVVESKALLRGLVGSGISNDFELSGQLPLSESLPRLDALRDQISQSPYLQQVRAAAEIAEAKLKLEESLRNPGLTLKAGVEQDPDLLQYRLGLAIPLPLWTNREGQIAEASANIRQAQAQLGDRELGLSRDLETAYQRYLIAQGQVNAFETGLLEQAQSVLKVAEAAYKFGERGILEYLDAQRTYRSVRKDYLAARYDYVAAMLEIERLIGAELLATKE
jgi:cobalt-zinc-cadmium efflux system outer membrane protein